MHQPSVLVMGAEGHMGRLVAHLAENDGFALLPVDVRLQTDPQAALDEFLPRACLVVDFSSPQASLALLERLQNHPLPSVIGTTGLTDRHHALVEALAQRAPVVCATNFSLGMNLLWFLAEAAAAVLPPDLFDVEIVEAHHRRKKDAPSGSARTLAACVQAGRSRAGFAPGEILHHAHSVDDPRFPGSIGVAVVRGGDVVGEHALLFLGDGERMELAHRATDRSIFAHGAWAAARRLLEKPPGQYSVRELLGLVLPPISGR